MAREQHSFQQLASVAPSSGLAGIWGDPSLELDLGGKLAVWAEKPALPTSSLPWMVLHGGPGGALTAAHVAPLRFANLPWFGFDQRNSGQSEDLDLSVIDTQRFIDDALDIADSLGISTFNILGGSWGATLALAIATYVPQRVQHVVLRAPFVPIRPRIDAFFAQLEALAPYHFEEAFGPGARTAMIAELFDVATPDHLLELSAAWRSLEMRLLGAGATQTIGVPERNSPEADKLVRKYRLQAHFLKYDCFFSAQDWNDLLLRATRADWSLNVVQGLEDKVCPPGGAKMLAEMIPRARLVELEKAGHLPDSSTMMQALAEVLKQL